VEAIGQELEVLPGFVQIDTWSRDAIAWSGGNYDVCREQGSEESDEYGCCPDGDW